MYYVIPLDNERGLAEVDRRGAHLRQPDHTTTLVAHPPLYGLKGYLCTCSIHVHKSCIHGGGGSLGFPLFFAENLIKLALFTTTKLLTSAKIRRQNAPQVNRTCFSFVKQEAVLLSQKGQGGRQPKLGRKKAVGGRCTRHRTNA